MAVADITNFEVTYKDVMAPIGYKRTMCGMDGSVGGNITRGLDGAFPTFVWSEHGDAPRAVADLDLIEETRKTWQFYRDRRPDAYGDLTKP